MNMCQVITTYKSKNSFIKHTHTLYGNTPYGDYLLLKEQYSKEEHKEICLALKEIGIYHVPFEAKKREKLRQLVFNTNFLKKKEVECGNLRCVFCGKENLIIYKSDDVNKIKSRMATADHFNPKDNGGKAFDENNLVVACLKCNRKKSNKLWSIDTLKYISHYGDEETLLKQLKYD